jgi:hypothetical protein
MGGRMSPNMIIKPKINAPNIKLKPLNVVKPF